MNAHRRTQSTSIWRRIAVVVVVGLACSCTAAETGTTPAGGGPATVPGSDVVNHSTTPPRHGGTLTIGLTAETDGFDPTRATWAGDGYQVARALFDPLAAFSDDGTLHPFLAESFTPNDDYTEWTITVRPNIRFHDGEPLDGAAVKANLDASRKAPLNGLILKPIVDVAVTGPLSVKVTSDKPWSSFPGYLSAQPGFMVSPKTLTDENGMDNPMGTGPFKMKFWERDNKLVAVRNPDYWRAGLPYLDEVTFVVNADTTGRSQAFDAGDFDVLSLTQPRQTITFSEKAKARNIQLLVDRRPDQPEVVLGLNTTKAPLDDVDARRAIAHAIDTEILSSSLYDGLWPAARGPVGKDSPWYVETDYPRYDPAEARRLAEAYQQTHGTPITFSLNVPADPVIQELAIAAKAMLAEVGIAMEIRQVEQIALLTSALYGTFEATGFVTFSSPTGEGENIFLSKDYVAPVGQPATAFTRLADDEMSAALAELRTTLAVDEMRAPARVIQRRLGSQVPFVFLVSQITGLAAQPDVRNLGVMAFPDGTPAPKQDGSLIWLTEVWVER